jgi:cysteine-rich repeat protein
VKRIHWVIFSCLALLSGCGNVDSPPPEDCAAAGDEDMNGLADCDDPMCAGEAACQPMCGNGKIEVENGEICDDGNLVSGDGCDANCKVTGCGNGVVTAGEMCDDSNATNGDGCDNNCRPSGCGNGIVSSGEECDDGNGTSGDGCDANCKVTGCGNGVVTAGEVCDDGNATNGDGCDNNCRPSGCGNGIVSPGEECDDGNGVSGDGCDANCRVTGCGSGIVTAGEQCDDGNTSNTDGCTNMCRLPVCGDGYVRSGVEQCDDANTTNGDGCDNNCTVTACGNGIVTAGEQCDDGNTSNTDGCTNVCRLPVCGDGYVQAGVEQCDDRNSFNWDSCNVTCTGAAQLQGKVKPSNAESGDSSGYAIALSADGSTLAIGAPNEASAATGSGGDQADNTAPSAGAVYIFVRSGSTWVQQAYLKASNTEAGDQFGSSVALSADGSTLAVGAIGEDSSATGVGGDQINNNSSSSGAVYVFTRSGTTWIQQAYVKGQGLSGFSNSNAQFGRSVALSNDGSTLAVGSPQETFYATAWVNAGKVYVFTRSTTTWSLQAAMNASSADGNDHFGFSIALSGDGSTLAVGAPEEDGSATGINGTQTNNATPDAGAAYVFKRSGTTWSQQFYIKASNTEAGDRFGSSVALSVDASMLAVGAPGEDSAATAVGGNQTSNAALDAGAVYVFGYGGTTWGQEAYVKASNTEAGDAFGTSVTLSANGSTLAVGAPGEDSAATGIGGNQADNLSPSSGAAYIFSRILLWGQQAYVKASGPHSGEQLGSSIALPSDALTLAVGAPVEGGVSGAVYVYH